MSAAVPGLRRELVFGFVSPLGVNREIVVDALRKALDDAAYELHEIHVSETLYDFAPQSGTNLAKTLYLERKQVLMDAGDAMRRQWSRRMGETSGDAVALAAILSLRQKRKELNEDRKVQPIIDVVDSRRNRDLTEIPVPATAYLLDSLKHPDELERLRAVYGPAFISIGIYTPPDAREKFLNGKARRADSDLRLKVLMRRDERGLEDDDEFGQRVADAFEQTDFIVAANDSLAVSMNRLVELLFGNVHLTPSLDEFGMYLARTAQALSSSLSRQVGASILREDGSVVAVGTNEVPKPIVGGHYWPEDDDEVNGVGRDRVYHPFDTSHEFRAEMMRDVLDRLAGANLLAAGHCDPIMNSDERLEVLYYARGGKLHAAKLRQNIDYVRAVHAEAAALLDCARHGVSVHGAQMFSTTFPCHECSRHIVAAGIKRVLYLEPYHKSGTNKLYKDSIAIDPAEPQDTKVAFTTFVGVAPGRYLEFFILGDRKRKNLNGSPITFSLSETSAPRLPYYTPLSDATIYNELQEVGAFTEFLGEHKSAPTINSGDYA